jgi:hypothetical protein
MIAPAMINECPRASNGNERLNGIPSKKTVKPNANVRRSFMLESLVEV